MSIGQMPGKLLAGLVVVDMDGGRCSWQQIAVRTLTRLFEVNPLLLADPRRPFPWCFPGTILMSSATNVRRWWWNRDAGVRAFERDLLTHADLQMYQKLCHALDFAPKFTSRFVAKLWT